jgi:hypothetical protein
MTPREQIQKAIQDGTLQIEMVFAPLINAVDIQIGKLEKANQDPAKYYDLENDEFINYFEIRNIYVQQKEKAITEFLLKMDTEVIKLESLAENADAPAISWEQTAFVIIKYALENGIKIKIGNVEWDSTKPLGGKNSIFDELRNTAMKSIGIDPNSEFGKIIKDPINAAVNIGENIGKETEATLNNIKNTTEKALEDVNATTGKALSDIKRETDKALEDARIASEKAIQDTARELGKIIPPVKITIKKPKWL